MLDLLSGLLDLLSYIFVWRFMVCVGTALAMIASMHFLLADGALRTGLSAGVGIIAVVVGIAWEFRSR